MKIQKIFSEIETGEKFYSVLMSEEELTLFSKIGEFVDTVKKARKFDKNTLTDKELKDLGIKTYEFKTYPGIKSRDEQILESREARKKLKKLGKKTAKGVAIGSAVAGGLYLGKKIYDKQKKEKEFSTAGREWAGFKNGMKGALKGAKWGAILAPGNLIAAGLGHPKTALGITAAGSLVGGGIGFKLGRDSGISEYKYKNDPEYKEKVDKEKEEECKKNIKYSLEQDLIMANEFSYREWSKLAEELKKTGKIIPKELLDYIKFYETTWKKNIKLWYDNVETIDQFEVVEFKEIFPLPISSKTAKEWLQDDDTEDLYILTINDAGDDGWGCYNFKTKGYGWDGASYGKIDTSLKKFISNHTKWFRNDYPLSKTQKELTEKFLRSI